MGCAARLNPRSAAGGKDRNAVAFERLKVLARQIETPRELERFVNSYPATARDQVRDMVRPLVTFNPDRIRAEDALYDGAVRVALSHG